MKGNRIAGARGRYHNASVLSKLTWSYVAVILTLAVVISVALFQISSRNYNERAMDLNRRLLDQYAHIVTDAIIEPVNKIRKDLNLGVNHRTDINELFAQELAGGKILALYNELNTVVNTAGDMIEGIHIYTYTHDFVVSSVLGLKYNHQLNRKYWPNLSWVNEVAALPGTVHWLPAREVWYTTVSSARIVTQVSTYPASMSFAHARGYIAIDVREESLRVTLGTTNLDGSESLFILDASGNLITHNQRLSIPATLADLGYDSAALFDAKTQDGIMLDMDGKRVLQSHRTLDNGWKLVSVISVDAFYSVTRTIALWAFGITAVAAAACVWISRRWARALYLPLKDILGRIRHVLQQAEGQPTGKNEFLQIDTALSELDSRIIHLNETWESHLPALKQNLLRSLIGRTFPNEQAFWRQMHNIAKPPPESNYRFLLIDLLDHEDNLGDVSRINQALIQYIESSTDSAALLIAGELSALRTGVFVCSISDMLESTLADIIAFARRVAQVDIVISVGSWQTRPLAVYDSYADALEARQQYFFFPWQSIFLAQAPAEDADDDAERSVRLTARFKRALLHDEDDELPAIVQEYTQWVCAQPIRSSARHAHLAELVTTLRHYARELSIPGSEVLMIQYPVSEITDIHEFEAWLLSTAERVLTFKRTGGDSRASDTVNTVKQYIAANLDKELSLTRLSEYTALSNSYLSHLFKESTGMGLVDYITQQRMERAKELLLSCGETIEAVARQLGYHTPHYFAKRFRQYYGVTPNQYRTNASRRDEESFVDAD